MAIIKNIHLNCKMKLFSKILRSHPIMNQIRTEFDCNFTAPPQHLICFKNWKPDMVMDVVNSALKLKCTLKDTHGKKLDLLQNCKIMILQEVNQPFLSMAVAKAASLLGADHVHIADQLIWGHDYNGRVFSSMADAIFVATSTHTCLQRFADQATVPVMCMASRTHAAIQALSTVMAIIEEYGLVRGLNIGYLGPAHPVLNSYLLLYPMLRANIKFKCCCQKTPVSPLLFKAGETMCKETHTNMEACAKKSTVIRNAHVIIAGPENPKKVEEFRLNTNDIEKYNQLRPWIFIHTCPRGNEVDDHLFFHQNSRTFTVFENFQYIAAALMAFTIKDTKF